MSFESAIMLKPILEALATILDIVGVIIIVYASIITLKILIKREKENYIQAGHNQHEIKLQFTSRLLTSLEFFIAADIIKTIVSPDPMTLLIVGITIAIRAALTFLLHKEQKTQTKKNEEEDQKNK